MSCRLERPAPQELFDKIKDKFSNTILGGFEVVPESLEWYVVSNDYAAHEIFYSIAEQQFKSLDPREACCEDLYHMAARRGVLPKPASFSQGYVRISGIPGSSLPPRIEVAFGSSRFVVISQDTDVMPESGFIVARVQAVIPGSEANYSPSTVDSGTLVSPLEGIDTDVQAYGSVFCGGSEEETCEEFRSRYIERLSFKPLARQSWLIDKIKEWPCVTRVVQRSGECCEVLGQDTRDCDCSKCRGTFEFYPLFDSTFDCGIPPSCVIDEMNTWLFGDPMGQGLGEAEIGICGKLYQAQPAYVNVRVGGMSCATMNQIGLVKERIRGLMRQAQPSQVLKQRTMEIAVSQVMGDDSDYTVAFEILSGGISVSSHCGDLIPGCDVLPCLNEIIVANAYQPSGC